MTAPDWSVEFDWRGESAYYAEGERRVWLTCIYWGGPGELSHIHAMWEHADGTRTPLSGAERIRALERTRAAARDREGITLRCAELDG